MHFLRFFYPNLLNEKNVFIKIGFLIIKDLNNWESEIILLPL